MHTTGDESPRGILHPKTGEKKFALSRFRPSAEIGFFVQRYWIVKWDLRREAPYRQTVLTHPNVNLVFEPELTRIYGVASATSSHVLQNRGWVLGLKFKPGGFYPFLNEPVSRLTDSSVSFREVFGMEQRTVRERNFCPGGNRGGTEPGGSVSRRAAPGAGRQRQLGERYRQPHPKRPDHRQSG
ncbi:DUF6597 domain-containing transcriptional factor [Paenibacillus ehimensis]|uniref:DUF6597 domain-containing transcriptional factor n=1 Tax=Paenibacillus ehimensis TaxID=79264 RepID=UPI003D2E87A7